MFTLVNNFNVSKNFKIGEFKCNDGSDMIMVESELIQKLQALRDILKKPIIIAAAYRTPTHNAKVGGSPNSQHLYGKAVDIKVSGFTPLQVALAAERVGFKGIGVYTNNGNYFTHIDIRTTKSYWRDNPGGKSNLTSIKSLK